MSDYINIPGPLLREVANELLMAAGPDNEQYAEIPVALVEGLREYLSDMDSDDHSVGICTCGTNELAYELGLALNGGMTCPGCGGDGFNFDPTQAKVDFAEGAKKYGISLGEAESMFAFSAGMSECEKCRGRGVARISDYS